jgi:hypothetical protein
MANTEQSRHPFARAGYAAPYRFVAPHEAVHRAGDNVQAAGTCDVCGTCYRYGATFADANGVEFRTGCDCAAKSLRDYDSALAAKAERAGKDLRNAAARERRATKRREAAERREREAAEREAGWISELSALDLAALDRVGHPLDWARDKGLSWADAVRWHGERGNVRRALDLAHDGLRAVAAGQAPALVSVPTVDPARSRHVGAVKERRGFRATVLAVIWFDGAYGASAIVKMVTDDGALLAWKTASPWAIAPPDEDGACTLEIGAKVAFRATVKCHDRDNYNDDAPVTWITRAKAA